jgi:predicted nucleotidyltransferase
MNIISQCLEEIEKLCIVNRVKSLFAFGSVTTDKFNQESDIDLIVDIDEKNPLRYCDYYFNLKLKLEELLKTRIDLLEEKSLKNEYFLNQIEKTKVLIYGKRNKEMA